MLAQLPEKKDSRQGLVVQVGGCAIGDIALVPAPMLKGLRDLSEWYMSIAANPEHLRQSFEKQTEITRETL